MTWFGCCETHRWIVHRLAGTVPDCAPIAPACPRPAVDSHDPARPGGTYPLRNQPAEPLLLLHEHLAPSSLPLCSQRNLRIASVLRRSLESACRQVGPEDLTKLSRRCQLRPRHPLTRGPLSNRPQGRSSQPGTEEPGVTARHAATAPTVPPESKPNSPDRRSSAMNSGNREILKLTALHVLSRLGWHHTGAPDRVMP
jgi:hypothetical protein